jgi:hypothetical protein
MRGARSRIVASIQPPCTRRPPSWTAGFRPGRSTGWPRSVRPRWTLGAGTPARWSRRSAMRAWWGTTSTPSGWPTRWPSRHADRLSRSSGPHLRPAVPHPQAAGDRGGAAHRAGRGAAAGPRHDEDRTRGRQVGESRQHQVASVVGQRHGTEPRVDADPQLTGHVRVSEPSKSLCWMPPTRLVSRPPAAGRDTRHERGGALSPPVRLAGRGSRTDSSSLLYGRKAPRGGSLRSCWTTLFAMCRWPG